MLGPTNAVYSVWASLVSGRNYELQFSDAKSYTDYLKCDSDYRYLSLRAPLEKGASHLCLIHPHATYQLGGILSHFFMVGDKSQYWDRFVRFLPVPVKEAWKDKLWEIGIRKELIKECQGHGEKAYYVNTSVRWGPEIKAGILKGVLT